MLFLNRLYSNILLHYHHKQFFYLLLLLTIALGISNFKANGIPFSLMVVLKNILIAVVIVSPNSKKIASACSFISLSVLIFKFVVAILSVSVLTYIIPIFRAISIYCHYMVFFLVYSINYICRTIFFLLQYKIDEFYLLLLRLFPISLVPYINYLNMYLL